MLLPRSFGVVTSFMNALRVETLKTMDQKNDIPIDVIHMIVRKLNSSRDIAPLLLLNRSWFVVAYEALWHTLSFTKSQNLVFLVKLVSVAPTFRFGQVKRSKIIFNLAKTEKLDLSACKWSKWQICVDPSVHIKNIMKLLPNIKSISFPPTKIYNPSHILKSFGANLEKIDLASSLGDRNRSLENIIRNIIQFCPNLRILQLPCVCHDSRIIHSLALNELGKLLYLEEISILHSSGMIHSHSSPLRGLFRSMTNLKKVKLLNMCCSE